MSTASARPDNLADFATRTSSSDDGIMRAKALLASAYESFQANNRWGSMDSTGLLSSIDQFVVYNKADANWVAEVGEAFRDADGSGDVAHASITVGGTGVKPGEHLGGRQTEADSKLMPQVSALSLDKKIANLEKQIKLLESDKSDDNWVERQWDGLGGINPLARSKAETLGNLRQSRTALKDMKSNDRNNLKVDVGDNGEDFRVIEAYGDLDTATRVVIHVPGMDTGARAYDSEGNLDAIRLQRRLNKLAGPGEKVAVVSWADYDVPMGGQEAAESGRARDGGKGLTEFTEKLNVMGMPSDKMSVVAHSYGSTTTGYGMQSGMDVGNVIVIGSPGMGGRPTQTRDDLGAPDTEVWVGRAWNDPVAASAAHGRDPGHPLFGAKLFSTSGSSWHSHYFDDDTDSQANLALLALDQPPIK